MTTEILKALLELAKSQKTTLYLDSSRCAEVSGGVIAGAVGGILLKDSSNSTEQWFEFGGLGVGVSIGLPAGFSYSDEGYDTWGGPIYKGPMGFGKLNFDDLVGAGHLITISAARIQEGGKGIGLSIVTMNESYGEMLACSALTIFAGTMIASPGAGAYVYKGIWRKVDK